MADADKLRRGGRRRIPLLAGAAAGIVAFGAAMLVFVATRGPSRVPGPEAAGPPPTPRAQEARPPRPVETPPAPTLAPPAPARAPVRPGPEQAAARADAATALAAMKEEMATACGVTTGTVQFHIVFDATGRERVRSVVGADAGGRKAAGCLIRHAPGTIRIPPPGRRVTVAIRTSFP